MLASIVKVENATSFALEWIIIFVILLLLLLTSVRSLQVGLLVSELMFAGVFLWFYYSQDLYYQLPLLFLLLNTAVLAVVMFANLQPAQGGLG